MHWKFWKRKPKPLDPEIVRFFAGIVIAMHGKDPVPPALLEVYRTGIIPPSV